MHFLKEKTIIRLTLCLLFAICLFYLYFTWTKAEKFQKEIVLQTARFCEALLPKDDLAKLTAAPDDKYLPEYKNVKNYLKEIVHVNNKIKFAYIWLAKNEKILFIADSESETSNDYSPPGQEYTEAKPEDRKPFIDGKEYITTSLTDRWGTWKSIYIPIKDTYSNKTIAVFCLDYNVTSWNNNIVYHVFESIIMIILVLILFFIILNFYRKNKSLKILINERLLAVNALLKSEEKFKNLIEASSDIIWETDINGNYTYISQQVENILGYSPLDLLGKSPFEIIPPEEANIIEKISNEIVKSQKPFNNLTNTILNKNGNTVILESSGIPIFDSNNNLLGYRGVDRDITYRKQNEDLIIKRTKEIENANLNLLENKSSMLNMMEDMENEIKERKQTEILLDKTSKQIKLILDVAGEGILGIDLKGLITFVNPKASEILGYKSDELLGKQGHSTFHHSYHDCSPYPENNCPNYKTLNEGKDYSGEDYFWRKDRTGFYVSYSSSPIYGEGIITGAVITFIDITNRKEFEKSIIEKSNELERFNNIMVDREIRMIALKKEINELLKKQGNNEKYKIAE